MNKFLLSKFIFLYNDYASWQDLKVCKVILCQNEVLNTMILLNVNYVYGACISGYKYPPPPLPHSISTDIIWGIKM
jgi:hypothetical protein